MYEILEFLAKFKFNYFTRTMGFEFDATANMSVVNLRWIRVMNVNLEFPTKLKLISVLARGLYFFDPLFKGPKFVFVLEKIVLAFAWFLYLHF